MNTRKAFTLIELLIVVAIIAILAAIAVPNFLEAQTRAKVSRCKADLRSVATAMECYLIDEGTYTRDSDSSLDTKDMPTLDVNNINGPYWGHVANGYLQLTTPVAYISGMLKDPFVTSIAVEGGGAMGYRIASGSWSYENGGFWGAGPINPNDHQGSHLVFPIVGKRSCYRLIGVGPDGVRARYGYKCFPFMSRQEGLAGTNVNAAGQPFCYMEYDATNGTVSKGDLYRDGGDYTNGRYMQNGQWIGSQAAMAAPLQ